MEGFLHLQGLYDPHAGDTILSRLYVVPPNRGADILTVAKEKTGSMKILHATSLLQQLRLINGERGLVANILGLFCVACMLGLANMVSQSVLHTNMAWLLIPLLVVMGLYFFVPYLILLVADRRSGSS